MTSMQGQQNKQGEQPVFALDIGTHSVIGVVGEKRDGFFHVQAAEELAHSARSMRDGQIQDIEAVAQVAAAVHKKLEERTGRKLTHVSVAAAGRTLLTQTGRWEETLEERVPVNQALIARLENGAVAQAHEMAQAVAYERGVGPFVCVGYTVTRYFLDDYPISALKGHTGGHAAAEVIATFLPSQVVDSLKAAMTAAGLTVELLTLEPIAAMNAVIPPQLRMLNLALVDIGAGTSDMAISTDGSVSAYTMATVAGDEVTEALSAAFLVDFEEAEKLKMAATQKTDAAFTDIMGREKTAKPEEITAAMRPAVEMLASEISARILKSNGERPPSAVFLVGGGSQAPELAALTAKQLGLSEERISVGGSHYLKKQIVFPPEVDGAAPCYATPMGIALTAAQAREEGRVTVQLNGQSISLAKNGRCRIMDVLVQGGFEQQHLLAPKGQDVQVLADGEQILFSGKAGTPALILCNGLPATLSHHVKNDDRIAFTPARAGEAAAPTVADLYGRDVFFTVSVEGQPRPAGLGVVVNGVPAKPEQLLRGGDRVESRPQQTLRQLGLSGAWLKNGKPCGEEELLMAGDSLTMAVAERISVFDDEEEDSVYPEAEVFSAVQAEKQAVPTAPKAEKPQEMPTAAAENGVDVRLNGRPLHLPPKADGTPIAFFDLLPYTDIDPKNPQGLIVITLNGRPAAYLDPLVSGDEAEIRWEKP